MQWLRDGLQIIGSSPEIESLAESVKDSGGVVFVPALAGLGAPHWKPSARGTLLGLSRGSTSAHVARATLEGIALQIHELVDAMASDLGQPLRSFRVDGGAAANTLLMQFQADILGLPIVRPKVIETTAQGAAFLAGLATKVWPSTHVIAETWREDRTFQPSMAPTQRGPILDRWKKAVSLAAGF